MRISRTYYEVMGLPSEADARQIKAKYHELARQFHPDRAADKAMAERLFVQINLAYRTLSDPAKRSVYDAGLLQSDASTNRKADGGGPPASGAPAPTRPTQPTAPSRPKVNMSELLQRANTAYMGGDRITTHKLCIEALRSDPDNAEAHALLGDVYADQGRRPDALTEYRTAQRAGDNRVSLQAKIKRLEGLIGGSGSGAGASAQSGEARPASVTQTDAQANPKKSGFLDKFTRK